MNALFWILVALLLATAVGAMLIPILKSGDDSPRYPTVLLTALGIPVLSLGLYLSIGELRVPEQQAQAVQPDVESMVSGLADRLQRQGGTVEEWVMLGRSYVIMGRYTDAVAAFAKGRQMAGEDDVELLAHYAEALILADNSQLGGEGGQIFERILQLHPGDPRGLWYGGLSAEGRGDLQLALARFERLGATQVPDEIRRVLDQRIAEVRTRLDGGSIDPPEPATDSEGPVIRVEVVAGRLDGQSVAPETPVFVLARAPGGRMPLAVQRHRFRDLPRTIELTQRDAMVGGQGLLGSSEVEVVARIALGGGAIPQTGDWFGSVSVKLPDPPPVKILIDQRVD